MSSDGSGSAEIGEKLGLKTKKKKGSNQTYSTDEARVVPAEA